MNKLRKKTVYLRIPPPLREVRLTLPDPDELLDEELRLGALKLLVGVERYERVGAE
jgi:hypothetical protein